MVSSKSAAAGTECEPLGAGILDPDGVGHSVTCNDMEYDPEDEAAPRSVVALDMPREVIARFSGSLILTELPERQPEIVFDRGPQFRDDEDE